VTAHAWLNTADSSYGVTPRVHAFNDGIVRVLALGHADDSALLFALDRVQRHAPHGVQVVFVTQTLGHVGSDLLSPADEVAWMRTLYIERRHATFAIAVWAGAKVAQESRSSSPAFQIRTVSGTLAQGTLVVGDGHHGVRDVQPESVVVQYQRYLPSPSPMPAAYRLILRNSDLVFLDGQGRIRGYQRLRTRTDESGAIQRLTALRTESPLLP